MGTRGDSNGVYLDESKQAASHALDLWNGGRKS